MKLFFFLVALIVGTAHSSGQMPDRIVIVMVEDDRLELIRALRYLKTMEPQLVCVNLNINECHQDETEMELAGELAAIPSLLMPSEVRQFGSRKYRDIIGCSALYPDEVSTGFTNLIANEFSTNQIDHIQLINRYNNTRIKYHMTVNIAMSLNPKSTKVFLSSHRDTIAVELEQIRDFKTYSADDFIEEKRYNSLKDKIVILGAFSSGNFLVREGDKLRKMSSSEIFANIALQIIDE